ncbi:type I-F CRISPR-associated helicase Cas3f [Pollutimonas bauzanensis]|uniref:CRISPR-associated helicase, Cas3 family n=1 Tax=Pollutimonas bauzanensis TaxID=658167 RepID=A0A1M5Y6M7_9BURK|nr:type I-F CRISPR-associated helicase Cas3f [Pollutimonas bauzanensis]SHI07143.1 CRISPR-associated helicase, Cas3 family [Pollutimonas bauzanensis]
MNILLLSQCDKRALVETRRILDQFAERRGDRTWQTPITFDGLEALRRLLRKSARKNTAVSCHWIRGHEHSELLWIVGDASRFNAHGATPTNSTVRNVLRRHEENDWRTGEDIGLLASLAALLHDLGKASRAFQARLQPGAPVERNQYRHEWVSLRLFQAFVGQSSSDRDWLQRLKQLSEDDGGSWLNAGRLLRDGLDAVDKPFISLPPLAQAVGWLVLTHHRLPVLPGLDRDGNPLRLGARIPAFQSSQLDNVLSKIDAAWNEQPTTTRRAAIEPYWDFPQGLPVTTPLWRKRASRLAQRLLALVEKNPAARWLEDPYIMHVARLSLMLADHHYSSLTEPHERLAGQRAYPIFANTDRETGELCQPLDEHLLGVAQYAGAVAHALPGFAQHLPRLVRHKGLSKRSQDERFRWQNRAADLAASIREHTADRGAFLLNMASTGCGKTLANARIMNALADPHRGLRCAFALGLRTLTLQTGKSFQDALQLSSDELAVRVGGAASRMLFEHYEQVAERSGSASSQALLPEDGRVLFEGNSDHPLLKLAMKDQQVRALLAAPLLVCTVDHLVPATESQRGGRQIAPMLRLMSGDLVLDELDDFGLDDLPALTRLVYWAGLLGSRVLLSSATLPPALVQGMFDAYLAGREVFQRNRGQRPGQALNVCCAWFDEFHQQALDCQDSVALARGHRAFAEKRHARLGRDLVRRRAYLAPLALTSSNKPITRGEFAESLLEQALSMHRTHHSCDPATGKRISFGLARMANIEPLFDVALALYGLGAPADVRIHLCVYHSQFPLLSRSAIEHRLDRILDRRKPEAVFSMPDIRKALSAGDEADHLFIVLGSPVTEVGRDHDYDWAVVEPSSMRSLIQLAGRVRRHRIGECATPNIAVFDTNLRHFEDSGRAAYCKPGFEDDAGPFRLAQHHLQTLLSDEERRVIDARPRILPRPKSEQRPQHSLVDLEHARLDACMLPPPVSTAVLSERDIRAGKKQQSAPLNASSIWTIALAHLTAVLPQQQPFRRDDIPRVDIVLLPDEDGEDYLLNRIQEDRESLYIAVDASLNHRVDGSAFTGQRIGPWCNADYMAELIALAESRDMALEDCAKRFGTVSLPASEQGWRFHPWLGFAKQR